MMNDEITLIPEKTCKGETGATYRVPDVANARCAFAGVDSVSMKEFYAAYAVGITQEMKATMYRKEYGRETLLEYEGQRYRVVRTYKPKNRIDMIELYCEAAREV